jgi:Sulfotransferase family
MIVSDSCRFVFAHVPKTGGIAMRAALEPFADARAEVLRETTHETLPQLLARAPHLGGHFKFAFVRNPWDRLVSFHAYARQKLRPTFPQMQDIDLPGMLRLLDRDTEWMRPLFALRSQAEHVRGADFVGRFEDLDGDFGRVCAQLNIRAALPRKNVSRHGADASYYDGWSRGFVAARYARDIAQFGYAFEALS